VEESSSGMVAVLSQHMPGGTEENEDKSLDSRCPGRDSNREPLECMSEALPLGPRCSVNINNVFFFFAVARIWTKLTQFRDTCLPFRGTYGTLHSPRLQVLSSTISFNTSL
jgi:hypothetical protein